MEISGDVPATAADRRTRFAVVLSTSTRVQGKWAAPSGKVYQVTNLFVVPDDQTKGLDLVVKYKTNDISDTGKTFIENKEVMKALLAKYPEFREPFGNLVARAVAPSGRDFGSMLP